MHKPLLIIGIDPGTTTAFAALNINGELLAISSSKEYTLSALILEITQLGFPLVVGCDKRTSPSFVHDFATKVGARLIVPEQDMTVDEKQELVRQSCSKLENEHECDACACAHFAFKKIRGLLGRIHTFAFEHHKESFEYELTRLVVLHGDLSIKRALEILEPPQMPEYHPGPMHMHKTIKKKNSSQEYAELYETMKRLERENDILKKYTKQLHEQHAQLKMDFNRMLQSIRKKSAIPIDERMHQKERLIIALHRQLKEKEQIIDPLQRELREYRKPPLLNKLIQEYKKEKYK